jgi:hypothetical protein
MKLRALLPLLVLLSLGARAESAKTYQVTGPIVALTENVITVQKDDEKWEIARNSTTKADGKLAVGNKVTIHYRMTATEIENKDAGAATTDEKPTKKKVKK